jgi:SAM-dependent methyltransferase
MSQKINNILINSLYKSINRRLIAWLRIIRNALYYSILPIDSLFLRINRLQKYPPIHLRRHVHLLGTLDGTGAEFAVFLKIFANLKSNSRLLDIGCGCGLLELALEDYLTTGEAVGIDIHRPSITWAKNNIEKRKSNIHFIHSDIYNESYWRKGKNNARTFFDNYADTGFDIIVAKSLFTHMLIEEMEIYISEISKRLKDGGKAMITFFLLNAEQHNLEIENKNKIFFINTVSSDKYSVRSKLAPTAAVAYQEDYILEIFKKYFLVCESPIVYGGWAGRENTMHFQDIIIFTKRLLSPKEI